MIKGSFVDVVLLLSSILVKADSYLSPLYLSRIHCAIVKSFYQRHLFADTAPVEGAFESLVRAKETIPGLEFVIVTARGEPERVGSQIWVDKFYPGVFRELYFTGAL